jgi:hypothetical protein
LLGRGVAVKGRSRLAGARSAALEGGAVAKHQSSIAVLVAAALAADSAHMRVVKIEVRIPGQVTGSATAAFLKLSAPSGSSSEISTWGNAQKPAVKEVLVDRRRFG